MVKPDAEEDEKKKKRRRRIRWTLLIIVLACVALAVVYFLLARNMTYDDYTVTDEVDQTDTSATHYLAFGDGYVKYSNDGASYITDGNTLVWNQGYEMEYPLVAVCEPYIVFADMEGETIYVQDSETVVGEISVTMPIIRIDVASQGTVAVLMEDGDTGYLSLFDKTGDTVAEGAIHAENTGTPTDIALSDDATNLAVSVIDVSSGTARTTINFYNFSSAGQNQIDNLVGKFQYADTIVPEITYADEDRLLAFADTGIYIFEGDGNPLETGFVEAEDEIQSIFYDEEYFGFVYNDASRDLGRLIYIYDTDGDECAVIETDFAYDEIGFLDNHEICIYNSSRCDIYSLSGSLKFNYEFDEPLVAVFHQSGYRHYEFLKEGVTEQIRLKLFGSLFNGQNADTADAESEPAEVTIVEPEVTQETEGTE